LRNDPTPGPPLVTSLKIEKVAIAPFPLHQTETPGGSAVYKSGFDGWRVEQWPPDISSVRRLHSEPIRIVNGGAVVIESAVITRVEKEHAGERSKPHPIYSPTREQQRLNVDDGR
jgi:hypothetical protein